MNCNDADLYAEAFRDSELDAATALELHEHLGQCPPCRERFEQAAAVDAAILQRLKQGERTEWLWHRLEASLEDSAGNVGPAAPRRSVWRELLWPDPRFYLAVAGVWLLLGVVQGRLDRAPATQLPSLDRENRTVVAWLEHRQALRRMLDLSEDVATSAKEDTTPSPRSGVRHLYRGV